MNSRKITRCLLFGWIAVPVLLSAIFMFWLFENETGVKNVMADLKKWYL
jgi:ABC-type sugar transport system permease subunit